MSRKIENTGFICVNCGKPVTALTNGSYRNHCPHCLYSLHVDYIPGDRSSDCLGLMRPVSICWHSKKGYQIMHRCELCGSEKVNRIATDCNMPDDMDKIIRIIHEGTF